MNTYIKDTYKDLHTRTLLHGYNGMTKLEKERVFNVLKYLSDGKCVINLVDRFKNSDKLRKEFVELIKKSNNYDELKESINGCETDECLMAHAILSFHIDPKSLLMLTTAIHTRVKPLDEGKNAWFDNFSLNAFLYQLTTFVYNDYDDNSDDSIFSISRNKELIKKDKTLRNPQSLLYNLGNLYRTFLEFGIGTKEEIYKLSNKQATEYLDKLVEKYPYFTYQCHGCDCFEIESKTCKISDIYDFSNRYPNTIVGGILNTETYRSGRGQHWVALLFLNCTSYLICSQAGNYNSFHDGGVLIGELNKYGFAEHYNKISIQKDSSNCGLFSLLSNLMAINNLDEINSKGEKGSLDIRKIVDEIGVNAKGINSKGIFKLKENLIGWMSMLE